MSSVLKNNKIVKAWNGLSLAVRTSIAIMIASFFQSGMKLLFVPVFTRMLTTTEYGIVTVFESVQTTLGTITMLSLHASCYSRGMQEFKEDRDLFTSSLLFLSNVCTIVVGAVFLAMGNWITIQLKLSAPLLVLMFVCFLFLPAYNFWIARQRFEYKYQGMLIVTILINLLSPIFAVILVSNFDGDKGFAKIMGAEIVLLTVQIILYIRTFSKSHWKIKWDYVKYGFRFNLPLVPHYASQQILTSCDRIMIQSLIDSASAGIYGLSYQVASVVRIVWTSINTVLVPWEYDKIEAGKVEDIRRLTRVLMLCYAAACIGIMFVAPEVIHIFAPSSYHEGVYVIPPVIAGVFFSGMYSLLAILEFYYKKNIYVMVASTLAAVLNVILNFIFIPMFGYQAAAYTTLACYAVYAFLHAMNLVRLKIAYFYDLKALAMMSVAMIGICLVVAKTYNGILIRYALLLAMLVVVFIKRKMLLEIFLSLKAGKKKK